MLVNDVDLRVVKQMIFFALGATDRHFGVLAIVIGRFLAHKTVQVLAFLLLSDN